MEAYAQCMRKHGIPDFPDPEPGGGITIQGEDLSNPQFEAADEACSPLVPGTPYEDQPLQQASGEMLEYARCMREQGFPNFPDPQAEGDFDLDLSEHPELHPNTPRFQQANKACGGPSERTEQQEFMTGVTGPDDPGAGGS